MRLSPELEAKCLELAGKSTETALPAPIALPKETKSKYGSRWCSDHTGALWFQSEKERDVYEIRKAQEQAGDISDLVLQPKLNCYVNGELVCLYKADFGYRQHGELIYEDVKGFKTAVYKLKKRLVHACLGITIVES